MNIHQKLVFLFSIIVVSVIALGSYGVTTYRQIISEENSLHRESEINVTLVYRIKHHVNNQGQILNQALIKNDTNKNYGHAIFVEEMKVVEYANELLTNISHSQTAIEVLNKFIYSHKELFVMYSSIINIRDTKASNDLKAASIKDSYLTSINLLDHLASVIISEKNAGILEYDKELETKEHYLSAISIFTLFVIFLIFHFFSTRTIINPIKRLKDVAILINQGNYENRIEISGNDEISSLGKTFNTLNDRLLSYSKYMETSLKEVTQLVTDLDDANSTIHKKEIRISAILDNMSDAVITTTEEGIIESVNTSVKTMFGKTESFYLGEKLEILLPQYLCQSIPTLSMPHESEAYINHLNGVNLPVEISINKFMHNEVSKYVVSIHDIEQRKIAEKKLLELANYDPLTRLPNRNYFQDRLEKALLKSSKKNKIVALLFVDLDGFKRINDTLGHTYGDSLLGQFATRLQANIRHCDTAARWGGDEFIILIENAKSKNLIKKIAQEILNSMSDPFNLNGHEIFSSVSIGISIHNLKKDNSEGLLREADIAMHHAKDEGKNQYQFYSSKMNERGFERLQLETQLRLSMWNKEFLLHYQPQIDMNTGEVTGAEALARWQHPEKGLVSPFDFIPLLEETGLVIPVGEYLLQAACQQAVIWQKAGNPEFRISVNLSARQFDDKHLVNKVRRILEETGLNPKHLELEITESAMMRDADKTAKILNTFSSMGVDIAIDDFGTGHSSLSYLRQYPISTLKIDRSFVSELESQADDRAISQTIINMANNLRMRVVAEGVETVEQLNILQDQGCDIVQGFYYSRPLPVDDFSSYLLKKIQKNT